MADSWGEKRSRAGSKTHSAAHASLPVLEVRRLTKTGHQTAIIRVHRMSCPAHDKAVAALFDDLNQADFRHPETGMRLIYRLA